MLRSTTTLPFSSISHKKLPSSCFKIALLTFIPTKTKTPGTAISLSLPAESTTIMPFKPILSP
jgi:hypothetical protein